MAIYLDNAATSYPKPEEVYRAVDEFQRNLGTSAGRGTYRKAREAHSLLQSARQSLANLFGISNASRVVFSSGVTESLNMAIKGTLKPGDHVIASSMEHNAVWRCLKTLEAERDIEITVVPCDLDGSLDPSDVKKAIRTTTRLITMVHASNVTGTLMPISEVGAYAREAGVPFLVDAAQTAGAYPINVEALNIDILAFTGHKALLGPMGTGGAYIREGLEPLPLKEGGTGGNSALDIQPATFPERYEAGTLNLPGIAGLGAAAAYLLDRGVDNIRNQEKHLVSYALRRLGDIDGVRIYGPGDPQRQVGVLAFNVLDLRPEETAHVLDEVFSILCRAGLHCAPAAHRTIGTMPQGTIRLGFGLFNTTDDIEELAGALKAIVKKTRRF